TADEPNNTATYNKANPVLAQTHAIIITIYAEFLKIRDLGLVGRFLNCPNQFSNATQESMIFDGTEFFREVSMKLRLHRRFRRIRKTVLRLTADEREPSRIARAIPRSSMASTRASHTKSCRSSSASTTAALTSFLNSASLDTGSIISPIVTLR